MVAAQVMGNHVAVTVGGGEEAQHGPGGQQDRPRAPSRHQVRQASQVCPGPRAPHLPRRARECNFINLLHPKLIERIIGRLF